MFFGRNCKKTRNLCSLLLAFVISVSLFSVFASPLFYGTVFAQSNDNSNVKEQMGPNKWFVGKNLREGDYFRYEMCYFTVQQCDRTFEFSFWLKSDVEDGREFEVLVKDGPNVLRGQMKTGYVTPDPLSKTPHLAKYTEAYKTSIGWLASLAPKTDPKSFNLPSWGRTGTIGGEQVSPKGKMDVSVKAGQFDAQRLAWQLGRLNEIYIVPDMPYPVKGVAWVPVTSGESPKMYEFELVDSGNTSRPPEFLDVETTKIKEYRGCPQHENIEVSRQGVTNTQSVLVKYRWAPADFVKDCPAKLVLEFRKPFAEDQFVNNVHWDLLRVNNEGNKVLWSYAQQEVGRSSVFSTSGQLDIVFEVEAPVGKANYMVYVKGTGPQHLEVDPKLNGLLRFSVDVNPSPSEPVLTENTELNIPVWIKSSANWWAQGQIDDDSFVKGIQYLIKENIMRIPQGQEQPQDRGNGDDKGMPTEIPSWIKNNAGWWAQGQITDKDFVIGIQWLVTHGVIKV